MLRKLVLPILALAAALAVGLFGGILLGQNTSSSTAGASPQGGFDLPTDMQGGLTSGTVTGIEGDVVTLELADGTTVTVTTSADTSVTTTTDAAVADLAAGDTVTVVGETDDAGNVTSATSIAEGAVTARPGFGG